uniref:Uncharacterized protein n=1 Tax=Anguilla anguilla TaxID=7936 RepID=A0A0E9RNV4_ANGAN
MQDFLALLWSCPVSTIEKDSSSIFNTPPTHPMYSSSYCNIASYLQIARGNVTYMSHRKHTNFASLFIIPFVNCCHQ